MLCKYGCGNDAVRIFKDGSGCCSNNVAKCPTLRKKFSEENKTREVKGCKVKGFKQPKQQCSICSKQVSVGNFAKHFKWCSGEGQDKQTCVICGKVFHSWDRPKTCSPECLSVHQSKRLTEMYNDGTKTPYGGSGSRKVYHSDLHGDIKVMSSYEYEACHIFDKWHKNKDIAFWEYTKDRFSYLDEVGKKRTYFPDFKVFRLNGSCYYVETKGFQQERDEFKWRAVREQGHELQTWFSEDIMKYKDNKD